MKKVGKKLLVVACVNGSAQQCGCASKVFFELLWGHLVSFSPQIYPDLLRFNHLIFNQW